MSRHDLTDQEWNAIRVFVPAERPKKAGRPWNSHRKVINGIFWILATGGSWNDIPAEFGKYKTIYNRFRRWTKEKLWERIERCLLERLDADGQVDRTLWCIDGSVIRAHRVPAGAARKTLIKTLSDDPVEVIGRKFTSSLMPKDCRWLSPRYQANEEKQPNSKICSGKSH